ncbi:orotate phosphoribosyltransferase [Paenibacillus chitinolyticus]|uniref:orotate phosphoribosyltransferase n=1 Tax=Paenibacillus chitinolyticus TaxID=79263 RepID=UPI0035D6B5F0
MDRLKELVSQSIIYEKIKRRTGGTCDFYVDTSKLLYNPEIITLAAEKMIEIAYARGATHVGGEATSALPLVGAILALSSLNGKLLHGFMIRKELKLYGKSNIIEGDLPTGCRVLLIDDVTGMGSASKRCCFLLQKEGIEVVGYSSIIDRQETACEQLWELYGVELFPLFIMDEIAGRKV